MKALFSVVVVASLVVDALAQSLLPSMPRYDRFREAQGNAWQTIKRGDVRGRWLEGGRAYLYDQEGKTFRLDIAKRTRAPLDGDAPAESGRRNDPNQRRPRPERGRQFTTAFSADGALKAAYRDGNLWISKADGSEERQLTREGDLARRLKIGSAGWVYGEELGQIDAFGFSPNGQWLWAYRYDESPVQDYFLATDITKIQNSLMVEAYPKAGTPNPIVDLIAIEVATGRQTKIDVREGRAFDEGVGHYVYGISWSPDGREIFYHRTNRWQNEMEFCAADPETGRTRVIVRESWPASWTENQPQRIYLDRDPALDAHPAYRHKAIWRSERTGWANLYLVDLRTGATSPITQHEFEVLDVRRVDLKRGEVWYIALSGDTPYKPQLHRVKLDATGDVRLTDPSLAHQVDIAPDGESFVATSETKQSPPVSKVYDRAGKPWLTLATSDLSAFHKKGLKKVEVFQFLAADGRTPLWGELDFPSDFDPTKKYPLIVEVYGGPDSGGISERFEAPSAVTELGFLVARFAGRGTLGRGKAFKDALYQRLGGPEIDDQAFGVKFLAQRPYVDGTRVGIWGVSYGGYAAALALLRYPEVFAAAAAASSVTTWENYDTIYTERYMRTPQVNPEGYKNGSCMEHVENLKGRLMLYYGTADDNVHPANTYQLVKALQRAGKTHELQVGPDQGHTGMDFRRMMEFFIDALILRPSGR